MKLLILFIALLYVSVYGQQSMRGIVIDETGVPVPMAKVYCFETSKGALSDSDGSFKVFVNSDSVSLKITSIGFFPLKVSINFTNDSTYKFVIEHSSESLNEFVVSGNLEGILKRESPIPIEVYSADYLQKVPAPSIFEATQNINGVRPQVNCSVCNTGDVHINGMEGPYTMVTIDGMPVVGGLSSVYGLQGIPSSLMDRVEVVKGPASTLYGSEAVGGLINVITVPVIAADKVGVNYSYTSWNESQLDFHVKYGSKKVVSLLGVDHYNYSNPIDKNGDNFTDLTIKKRISLFHKTAFLRKSEKTATLLVRYMYEDRWGGEVDWEYKHRGGTEKYGESIFTNRLEFIGTYELPIKEKVIFSGSYSRHIQDSYYGDLSYQANQNIGFGQLVWHKKMSLRQNFLLGTSVRSTYYDDNTTATQTDDFGDLINRPDLFLLPGVFAQDEFKFNEKSTLLAGIRYDYHNVHKHIVTPRLSYKFDNEKNTELRFSYGNGFRVVNIFTEDHAALTGARTVEILNDLNPERTHNGNINLVQRINAPFSLITLDASLFYTYFSNKIVPDYLTDDSKIIYDNLDGYAVSQGATINMKMIFEFPLRINFGATFMNVFDEENGVRNQQLLTEKISGTWSASYAFKKPNISIDYSGSVYGPMKLPVVENDIRSEYSETYSIQNIKVSWEPNSQWTFYTGVRNLANFTPPANSILRSFDPFDTTAADTISNPNGYTFDPSYVYASFQGVNFFAGVSFKLP
ncbi:MAG: outer membrane receptor for ferrienterochelin and colicins [Parvicella sp.]|jgi:outer membrane receptor for ferrienterochelin and colicins